MARKKGGREGRRKGGREGEREEGRKERRRKEKREKFCRAAVRMGYINSFQRRAILNSQLEIQPKLGNFFIEKNLVSRDEIISLIKHMKEHNIKVKEKLRSA